MPYLWKSDLNLTRFISVPWFWKFPVIYSAFSYSHYLDIIILSITIFSLQYCNYHYYYYIIIIIIIIKITIIMFSFAIILLYIVTLSLR